MASTSSTPSAPGDPSGSQRLAQLGCNVVERVPGAYAVASLGPCVVSCVGVVPATAGCLDAFSLANSQVARQHERFGNFVLFGAGCTLPGTEERSAVIEVVRSFQDQLAAAAVVLEGTGLGPVVIRSIVNILGRASGTAHPRRVFTDLGEASEWLVSKLPQVDPLSAPRLRAVVAELRNGWA